VLIDTAGRLAASSGRGQWWLDQFALMDGLPEVGLLSASLVRAGVHDLRAELVTPSGVAVLMEAAPCRGPDLDAVVLIVRSGPTSPSLSRSQPIAGSRFLEGRDHSTSHPRHPLDSEGGTANPNLQGNDEQQARGHQAGCDQHGARHNEYVLVEREADG
jgi:hypothetical protein